MARAMVASGVAEIADQNGKVKSVRLLEAASTCASMIGPATGRPTASRFAVRDRLDCGAVVWRHHWRATDYR
jgi:hypothetical protein